MRRLRGPLGLLGRILAILLLTVVIEFGASTLLYERASSFTVHEDDAHRLAEHLMVTRRVIEARPRAERPQTARLLSSSRYAVQWIAAPPPASPAPPQLDRMRRQIVTWEPRLDNAGLTLQLAAGGRRPLLAGTLRLGDGSGLVFEARESVFGWKTAVGRILLALVPVAALLLIGGMLIRRQLRPLGALAVATGRIGSSEQVAIEEQGTAEVRRLIRAFNAMQDRIHQLVEDRTQALAAVGHDLRTPLARLQLRVDGVRDAGPREEMRRDLDEMGAMLGSLLAFLGGEQDPETPERIDLAVLVASMADRFADDGHDVSYDGPHHLDAIVRPISIRRALANLVENAVHYAGGAVVGIGREAAEIVISVVDDGPGIAPDRIADVLQPFVRLDEARGRNTEGLGLGLAIVTATIAREGGALLLVNRPEGGLRAELRLPG